jgi:energy-coupling factor transporter transmembrane protein EcfT
VVVGAAVVVVVVGAAVVVVVVGAAVVVVVVGAAVVVVVVGAAVVVVVVVTNVPLKFLYLCPPTPASLARVIDITRFHFQRQRMKECLKMSTHEERRHFLA